MSGRSILFILLPVFLVTFGCSGVPTSSEIDHGPMKVGVIGPISGPSRGFAMSAINAYKMVFDQHNAMHPDQPIELVEVDGSCSIKGGMEAAFALKKKHGVSIVLGGLCSAETIGASRVAKANDMLLISPTSTSADLAYVGDHLFKLIDNGFAARTLGKFLDNSGFKKIMIIKENTQSALPFAYQLVSHYDGTVVSDITFDDQTEQVENAVMVLDTLRPDGLVLFTQSPRSAQAILEEMLEKGLYEQYLGKTFGGWMFGSPGFRKSFQGSVSGLIEVNMPPASHLGADAIDFMYDYTARYSLSANDTTVITSQIAADLLVFALEAGNRTPDDIKAYLKQFTQNNPIPTLMGPIYFDNYGNAMNVPYIIHQIQETGSKILQ